MIEFPFDTTRAVADLLLHGGRTRHPGLRLAVPHGGGALAALADRVDAFARIFAGTGSPDVAGQLRGLYYDLAGAPVPRQLPSLLALTDPSHLLYGTDWPWTPENRRHCDGQRDPGDLAPRPGSGHRRADHERTALARPVWSLKRSVLRGPSGTSPRATTRGKTPCALARAASGSAGY